MAERRKANPKKRSRRRTRVEDVARSRRRRRRLRKGRDDGVREDPEVKKARTIRPPNPKQAPLPIDQPARPSAADATDRAPRRSSKALRRGKPSAQERGRRSPRSRESLPRSSEAEGPAQKSKGQAPVVTVFGGGVAGLSVAHELIERGFIVQVVEREISQDREYECEVGGMARSQFGRIKADLMRLHPYLFPGEARDYLESVLASEILDPEVSEIQADPKHPFKDEEERRKAIELLQKLRLVEMQPVHRRFGVPERIRFDASRKAPLNLDRTDDHKVANREKLERVAETLSLAYDEYENALNRKLRRDDVDESVRRLLEPDTVLRRREILVVEIRGHTDSDGDERENREASLKRAMAVRDHLLGLLAKCDPKVPYGLHFVAVAMGSQESEGISKRKLARELCNRVDFQIVEQVLPGEHGYRFFPACYRHLFELMKRTPLLDRNQQETGFTAFDQLVTPPPVAIGLKDTSYFREIGRQRPRSLEDLRELFRVLFTEMGLTPRDALRYGVQLAKFMTSCPERRQLYEGLSWVEFVNGQREIVPRGGQEPEAVARRGPMRHHTKYSERAEYLLYEVSQALIAMDAEETDAHTHGLTSVQLLLDYLETRSETDLTLNGPTSLVWLYHWKTYLKRQGVRFFVGEVDRLKWDEKHGLVPEVKHPFDAIPPSPEVGGQEYISHEAGPGKLTPDFYVLALPFEKVCDLVWSCAEESPHDPTKQQRLDGVLAQLRHFSVASGYADAKGKPQLHRSDTTGMPMGTYPLRDLSGIQYFFRNQARIGRGHMVYPDTPWGLSSISQLAHWRERRAREGGFLGLLSVDIGDFYDPYPTVEKPEPGAILPTAWKSTREEIANKTWEQVRESSGVLLASLLERPNYYHVDESIEFDDESHLPVWNHAPFLINLPSQWEHRPGVFPPHGYVAAPGERKTLRREYTGEDSIWYGIANDHWSLAGTHMATLTRLATMESANESARHAVDAILRKLVDQRLNPQSMYNSEGKMLGEFCRIFDPADHEPADLQPFKRLDKQLFDQGLPHALDILGVLELVDRMPERGGPETERSLASFLKLLERSARTSIDDWEFASPAYADAVQAILRHVRGLLNPSTKKTLRDFIDELSRRD